MTPAISFKAADALVAVIIPAYNAAATIDETLRSARAQTHRKLEIVVVDDGSDDATPVIVARHAAEDDRVRLIRQDHAGVAAARNRGIAEASADLIAPLDADDLWAPAKIERQLEALKRGGNVALVYAWFAVIDEHGMVQGWGAAHTDEGQVLRRLCQGNFIGNASSPLIRKRALLEAGGYDPTLRARGAQGCEDLLLYFRLAERGEFAVVPEYLTGYRHGREAMSSSALRMLRSYRIVAAEMTAKHPEFRADIRRGEARMADWLFWRAARARRWTEALRLAAHVMRASPRHACATFAPALGRAAMRRLLRRPAWAPTQSLRFPAGALLRAKADG